MYPGPAAPTLGTFVADIEAGLEARGHELARAVVDRRGGHGRHLGLARDVVRSARRFRPDVVYAHFLVPAGLLGAIAGRAPAVLTAHGQDVANAERSRVMRGATRLAVRRAASVIAVSDWLRLRLEAAVPGASGKTTVIDCGVDLDRFAPGRPRGGSRRGRLGAGGDGVPLRRHAQRAEERHPPRRCLRAPRRGVARVRRGRAAPRTGSSGGRVSTSPVPSPTTQSHGGSRLRTSCASRASSSLSGWQRSRRWRAPARSSRLGWAVLPSSSRPGRGCSSTRWTRRRSPREWRPRPQLPRPNEAARAAAEAHDVRRQVERIEALLESATRAPAAAGAPVERR